MDRRLTLLTRVLAAPNAQGEKIASYETLATVWGRKQDISGREFFASGQLHAEASTRFTIRHRTDLTSIHRLTCEGVNYDIVHIAEMARRVGLEILCKALL